MVRRNRYELNYARLEALIGRPLGDLTGDSAYRLKAQGFMDLVVEVLPRCRETGAMVLSLAHYFEQNGDLCQDPEMVLRIFPPGSTAFLVMVPSTDARHGRVEATMFQQAIPPIYREVYPELGKYSPKLRRDLNAFLTTWLRNLTDQGHRLAEPE
jgi:uncharacterized protein YqiB (DUF1249 family)